MTVARKNEILGTFIRARRHAKGLSLKQVSELSGLHASYWSKLETGYYLAPRPKHLQTIARVIDVRYEDLYGLTGYDTPERLPTFAPYLRTKYHLPTEAVAELERYFALLRAYYGIPDDEPVFPPKPAPGNESPPGTKLPKRDRRAA